MSNVFALQYLSRLREVRSALREVDLELEGCITSGYEDVLLARADSLEAERAALNTGAWTPEMRTRGT